MPSLLSGGPFAHTIDRELEYKVHGTVQNVAESCVTSLVPRDKAILTGGPGNSLQ